MSLFEWFLIGTAVLLFILLLWQTLQLKRTIRHADKTIYGLRDLVSEAGNYIEQLCWAAGVHPDNPRMMVVAEILRQNDLDHIADVYWDEDPRIVPDFTLSRQDSKLREVSQLLKICRGTEAYQQFISAYKNDEMDAFLDKHRVHPDDPDRVFILNKR